MARIATAPRFVIMRTFVKLRQMLESHAKLAAKLAELEDKYDEQFRVVFEVLNELMSPPEPKRKPIGFQVRETQATYAAKSSSSADLNNEQAEVEEVSQGSSRDGHRRSYEAPHRNSWWG